MIAVREASHSQATPYRVHKRDSPEFREEPPRQTSTRAHRHKQKSAPQQPPSAQGLSQSHGTSMLNTIALIDFLGALRSPR
jgi:hypothetical protein